MAIFATSPAWRCPPDCSAKTNSPLAMSLNLAQPFTLIAVHTAWNGKEASHCETSSVFRCHSMVLALLGALFAAISTFVARANEIPDGFVVETLASELNAATALAIA